MSGPVQGKDESDADFFKRWKEHVKDRGENKAVWLKDAMGREVEIYCARAPKVNGKVKAVDLRFGRVLIETESEIVEISMGAIQQVRFPK